MASEGPNNPSSASQTSAYGASWSNMTNAYASDDARAGVALTGPTDVSERMRLAGFGFSIPSAATIDGVLVTVESYCTGSNGGTHARNVCLFNGTAEFSDAKEVPFNLLPDATDNLGGASDTWNAIPTLTPAIVNDSSFGVSMWGTEDDSASWNWLVDHVTITIYYTAPALPDPPTDLTATTASTSQIDLSWTAPADPGDGTISGYKIERESPTGGGWSTLVADTGGTGTTYSDVGLDADTQYNYRVSAITEYGAGDPSTADSTTTIARPALANLIHLSPMALTGRAYTFAEKGGLPHTPGRITQLSPMAITARRYGSFGGKAATHTPGRIVQLAPTATPSRRYGSFAGKTPQGMPIHLFMRVA